MFNILTIIPGRKKLTSSGWYSCNGVCCSHRGHRPDIRSRLGIKLEGNNWRIHCFNCSFSCQFVLGTPISQKTRSFLVWCGVDNEQIQKWNLESLQNKDLLSLVEQKTFKVSFKHKPLPDKSISLDKNNPVHKLYTNYLIKRKINPDLLDFRITPSDKGRNADRIIIPYTYKQKVVGFTSRFLDDKTPKYINEQQPGYVFNIDSQNPDWQVCLVMEGIFDALSINGVALMHNTISKEQAALLATLNKNIIVVPDQDKAGMELVDRSLELGYSVSIPEWGKGVKDVNDAVVKYGKLPTLLSILENATTSKIKLEMRKKKIV